jgi:hypothetical protein
MDTLIILGLLFMAACGLWKLFLLFFFPEAYLQAKQHKHDREMAKRSRNGKLLDLFGGFFR